MYEIINYRIGKWVGPLWWIQKLTLLKVKLVQLGITSGNSP